MPVTAHCPNCRREYQVREENLGVCATCNQCGQSFTLKMSTDETLTPQSNSDAPPRPSPPKSPGFPRERQEAPPLDQSPADARGVPENIGPYAVRRPLGGGAMGEVWLAWDAALQRDVAIKTLRPEVALSAQGLDRFLREARLAARLHHTNAVTVYQVGVEGTTPYIAMEYVEGRSLDKAVSPGQPMELREATHAIRDAAAGLSAAHKLDLIHRDVKPANLMRTTDGVTKVVDFGLARAQASQSQLTQRGSILGTPAYMAPELWRRKAADPRSDVYALACTYYCLLTGEPPFEAENPVALGYQHTHEPLPDPRQRVPDLPNAVCRILAEGANKDPDRRYQSADEMLKELEALLVAPSFEVVDSGQDVHPPPVRAGHDLAIRPPKRQAAASGVSKRAQSAIEGSQLAMLSRRAREKFRRNPAKWLLLTALTAVAFLVLTIVFLVQTPYGTVKIELSDPAAQVEVKVDGDVIDIARLKEPMRLKVGEHDLLVASGDYQTVSKSFTVRRGSNEVLPVSLEPNAKPLQRPPAAEVTAEPSLPSPQAASKANRPEPVGRATDENSPPLARPSPPPSSSVDGRESTVESADHPETASAVASTEARPDDQPVPNTSPKPDAVPGSPVESPPLAPPKLSTQVMSKESPKPIASPADLVQPGAASAAARVEVGIVKPSDPDFVIAFDSRTGVWKRLRPRAKLMSGERLLALPTYRPEIVLVPGVQVLLAGPTSVWADPPTAQGEPTLRFDYGRALISTAGVPGTRIALDLGGHLGTLTFQDAVSEIGSEVRRYLPFGADPETGVVPAARIHATEGRVVWQGVRSHAANPLQKGQCLTIIGDEVKTDGFAQPPSWMQKLDVNSIDRSASTLLEPTISLNRPVSLALMERTEDRKPEIRSLAARCLAYLESYESLVREFGDERQRSFWYSDFDVLRDSVAFSSTNASEVRKTLEARCGEEARDLYRLVWGYSPAQLADGADVQLVAYLNHDSLSVRVLAFENLRRITGKTMVFHPEAERSQRESSFRRWWWELESGEIRYKSPPTPP